MGLGNGKKRSQLYEDFVLKEREKMKNNLNLCEHTVQKLLHYSNNFLHKRLLTEQVLLILNIVFRIVIYENAVI